MLSSVKDMLSEDEVQIRLDSNISELFFDLDKKTVRCQIGDRIIMAKCLILGHGARLPKIKSSNGDYEIKESFHPRPAFHLVVRDSKKADDLELVIAGDPIIKYVHNVTRFSSLKHGNLKNKKVFVFALQPNIKKDGRLTTKLFKKLKDFGVIGSRAEIVSSLYSDVILPTLGDQDLYDLKEEFGEMVNILRTENFTAGIGHYADRWR